MTDDQIKAWCSDHQCSPQRLLSRERVMGVSCAQCGADRDESCRRRDGLTSRTSNHLPRVFDALRAFYRFDLDAP